MDNKYQSQMPEKKTKAVTLNKRRIDKVNETTERSQPNVLGESLTC